MGFGRLSLCFYYAGTKEESEKKTYSFHGIMCYRIVVHIFLLNIEQGGLCFEMNQGVNPADTYFGVIVSLY